MAGVMIRDSLNDNEPKVAVLVTATNGVSQQDRAASGGATASVVTPGLAALYWVKLVRTGSQFTGYRSPDGVSWTALSTNTVSMVPNAYIGLAVTSHANTNTCTVVFDSVLVTP